MAFAEHRIDVVPTHDGASYFTLPTKTRTRRMQGTYSGTGTIEQWVTSVEENENAPVLRDSTVEILDYDEFRNVLEVDVSTVGVERATGGHRDAGDATLRERWRNRRDILAPSACFDVP